MRIKKINNLGDTDNALKDALGLSQRCQAGSITVGGG